MFKQLSLHIIKLLQLLFGSRQKMCRLKTLLVWSALLLAFITILETCYVIFHVVRECHSLSMSINLLFTAFFCFAMLFFSVVLAVGALQSIVELLLIWLIWSVMEVARSSIIIYSNWKTAEGVEDEQLGKHFNGIDAGLCSSLGVNSFLSHCVLSTALQLLSTLVVLVLIPVIRIQNRKSKSNLKVATAPPPEIQITDSHL